MEWYEILIGVLLVCVSSAGFCSLIKYLLSRSKIRKDIHELKIMCSRNQLTQLMQNDPKNKDTIFKEAECYFLTLRGDGYMANEFSKWAEDNGFDIGWFKARVKDL